MLLCAQIAFVSKCVECGDDSAICLKISLRSDHVSELLGEVYVGHLVDTACDGTCAACLEVDKAGAPELDVSWQGLSPAFWIPIAFGNVLTQIWPGFLYMPLLYSAVTIPSVPAFTSNLISILKTSDAKYIFAEMSKLALVLPVHK